jgi:HEPN domain-containing protein
MTLDQLAQSYLQKARNRKRVLEVLLEQQGYSDVVREAQELVELALKAMLRHVGVDPPKWHDVSSILADQAQLFPEQIRVALPELSRISKWLRKERELSFYGDVDFIPTQEYGLEDARRAQRDALAVLTVAGQLIDAS